MIFRTVFFLLCFFPSLKAENVLVSIAPHQFFVEQIGGNLLNVTVMVPPGASAHTFEPTPKQVLATGSQEIWFRVGEGFEERAMRALKSHFPQLDVVDLRQNIHMINDGGCSCHGADPHIWLSVRLAQQQANTIFEALARHFPAHRETFSKNLQQFLIQLQSVDQEIGAQMAPLKNRTLVVSHPAYGYFGRDYQLQQLPVEFEGKDPSPKQLTELLQKTRELKTHFIFVQEQHSSKGARLLANELGATVIVLDPYDKDYLNNMRHIATSFARQQ